MAINNILSIRYSAALFSAARENKVLEKVEKDLTSLHSLVQTEPKFILSKVLPKQVKRKIWLAIIKSRKFNELTNSFLKVLIKNNRLYLLKNIIINFTDKLKIYQGVRKADFITAVQVNKNIVNSIKKELEKAFKDSMEMHITINPKLLGGFVLKIDSHMLDCSLNTKLEKIKHKVQKVRFN